MCAVSASSRPDGAATRSGMFLRGRGLEKGSVGPIWSMAQPCTTPLAGRAR